MNKDLANELVGLILCGGRSSRMGQDKYLLNYHGIPQWLYLAELLSKLSIPYYLSCRAEQLSKIPKAINTILDLESSNFQGPLRALDSAHKKYTQLSFLVLACDLVGLTLRSIQYLLANRKPNLYLSAYHNPQTGFNEPLCAIWETQGLKVLSQGGNNFSCPNHFINTYLKYTQLIISPYPQDLINANYPQDLTKS